jgi:hypothetical protein
MDGRDGSLDRVGAEASRCQRPLHERHALDDQLAVPQRAILVGQEDDLALGDALAVRRDSAAA